jgi:hypothetical protein
MKGQRTLVTGDSGCYGFRRIGGNYYKELLRPLAPLHVVQITHHYRPFVIRLLTDLPELSK